MRNGRTLGLILLVLLFSVSFLMAEDLDSELFGSDEEELLFGSEDDLFSDEDSLLTEIEQTETNLTDILLTNEQGVSIGGRFSMAIAPTGTWSIDGDDFDWSLGTSSLSSTLFFDARPDSDIRVYGKAEVSYPFTGEFLSVKELFSDFNVDEKLFFRVGKQALNWGVGYFFSPANLLNLTQVDPEDPTAELEGPLSVKLNVPVGIDNLYGYVILPADGTEIEDLAYAVKAEKVIGFSEVSLGAYWKYDAPPKAMMTLSTNLFNVISFFAEGVLSYGSTNTILLDSVTLNPVEFGTYTFADDLYFSATVGGMYSWSDPASNLGLTLMGQYYYNGEGYDGVDLFANPMTRSGFHYGAVSSALSVSDSVSASLSWIGNLSDGSGILSPSITWAASDYLAMNLGTRYSYGAVGTQYAPDYPDLMGIADGRSLATTLTISVGGTSF